MPIPYTAQPSVTKIPSPAPGPGVLPTINLPADTTDDVNAASVAQAMEVPADFIGHIQTAMRIDTPAVPASGSGFTALSYSAFGGTMIPSGSVKINTGTRFVIKIIAGGAVGVATFQTSLDGGNTFGGTQTTSASMTDATSGVTFAFAGTLTTNGMASFRSAYTPRLQLQDASSNGRWLLDHNGYPTGGRVSQFREEWTASVNPGSSGLIANTQFSCDLATAGSIAFTAPSASFNARYLVFTPTSTVGASTDVFGPALFLANAAGMSVVMEFEFGMNAAAAGTASKVSFWCGLQDGTADPSTNTNVIALYKAYNVANYQTATKNGVSSFIATGTAPTAGTFPTDRIRLEIQGSSSPYGSYQALWFINEALISVVTIDLPGAVAMRPVLSAFTENGAPVGSPLCYVGPVTVTWNRFTSGPAL